MNPMRPALPTAAARTRRAKNDGGSIGWVLRRAAIRYTAPAPTAAPSRPSVTGAVQPADPALISPPVSSASAAAAVTGPIRSTGWLCRGGSGTPARTSRAATAPTGRLIAKIARHPTAIYESLFVIAIGVALVGVWRHGAVGHTFKLFTASYLAFRLLVDTIKPGVALVLGLTAIQWACVCGLLYYAQWYVRQKPDTTTSARERSRV